MGSKGQTRNLLISQVLYWTISPARNLRENLISVLSLYLCYQLDKSPRKQNSGCVYKGLCRLNWVGKTYCKHSWHHGMAWDSKLSNWKSKLSSSILLPASYLPFLLPGLPSTTLYILSNCKQVSSTILFQAFDCKKREDREYKGWVHYHDQCHCTIWLSSRVQPDHYFMCLHDFLMMLLIWSWCFCFD